MEEETAAVTTEDVLGALLEYLVDPYLPTKFSPNDPLPDISLQHSTAKQMHAVVLLYNYYHRLQFSQLEFLDFESFCKAALSVRPSLLIYFKKMRECSSDGQVKDLSITEKAIMDACNICIGLITLKDAQSMEGWPVSKVAVFLTDSMMQKCLLKFSASTEGVWSLIETNVVECHDFSVGLLGAKKKNEKEKSGETHFQQLVMSAVKENTGIDPTELTILESHVVYSLSKEKTVARLFIMKCGSVEENKFEVTMKDAIDSLQGPLVKKNGNSYLTADIVEFFHLLPYAGIIRGCFSRKLVANGRPPLKDRNINRNLSQRNNEPVTVAAIKRSERSSATCQSSDLQILKTNSTKRLNQREDFGNPLDGSDSSKISHPCDRKDTSKNLVDNSMSNFHVEGDMKSTKGGPLIKKDKDGARRVACNNEADMDDQEGETGEIWVGGLIQTNDLVERRKRKRVCFQDGSSAVEAVLPVVCLPCPVNNDRIGVHTGLQGRPIVDGTNYSQNVNKMEDVSSKKDESQSQLIPYSMPEDVIWVGSVCFPRKYIELYQRIVEKFGDIIRPESKQITLCSELVSATMKSFFEVVDSMVHASPDTLDAEVLESWELKLKFCELSGLKVGWLHDHLKQVRQAFSPSDNAVVRELETRAAALDESLETKRKQAADLVNMLKQVRAEVKMLLEEKIVVDTNLEAVRARQKCFPHSLV